MDLFLYGLTEEQAIEKIKQIETSIRDSILAETTTIRTKNAITIVSQYPTRHVQIVCRLYKSISEILTGFDVDCSCVAYDGQQVWASPRAVAAFMTQVNTIDLTRRSPSYENRLSKYSHRGFEVYWPVIDRSRLDPTIFERSFSRVQGLARLLVLEKLPHPTDREAYLAKRRAERGRPPLPYNHRSQHELVGNVKDAQPDDVAEWVEEDEVSNYHTVTIPYGPKYHAKRIEKLLFTKDLLLNAEWNKRKDREANLHRHPAFFGSVHDVLLDCCGYCPKPVTDEDLAAYEEESKIYISGSVTFLRDDPGRQAIGSFNPITLDDWTEMAYVGNTTRLCQAIVDHDLEAVRDWFSSPEVVDVNRRDHTGRTPLHLAVMCSSPEIVQCLIEHGARLVARLYNGMTALHLAAHRGQVQMIKDILGKSDTNAELEANKENARKESRRAAAAASANLSGGANDNEDGKNDGNSSYSDEDFESDDDGADDMTEGSFVKLHDTIDVGTTENEDDPDVYDVDVLAWDSPMSPLHLAILGGHTDVVSLLVEVYCADVLLPVKIMDDYNRKRAKAAILTLTLAMELPLQKANEAVKTLLGLGATFSQADMHHVSALHFAVEHAKFLIVKTMEATDQPNFVSALNFIAIGGYQSQPTVTTPLLSAIRSGRSDLVETLIQMGAKTHIDFESFAQAYKRTFEHASNDPAEVKKVFQKYVEQPIIVALQHEMLDFVEQLIDGGENVNTLSCKSYQFLEHNYGWLSGKSLLDIVHDNVFELDEYVQPKDNGVPEVAASLDEDATYLADFVDGSYCHWTASFDLRDAKAVHRLQEKQEKKALRSKPSQKEEVKKAAVQTFVERLNKFASKLESLGAKSFWDLHPHVKKDSTKHGGNNYYDNRPNAKTEPYSTKISFHISDLTPEKRQRYIELFEASFAGETERVKTLCLQGERPLQIAVQDLRGFSPFSLAVIRGHLELALVIVEIAKAQYQSEDKTKRYHYSLNTAHHDAFSDDDEDDGSSEDDEEMKIRAEIVDETFTVDDVAALASNVKSRVSPSAMIQWHCQLRRAFDAAVDSAGLDRAFGKIKVHHRPSGNPAIHSWTWFNSVYSSQSARRSLMRFAIFDDNIALLKFLLKVGTDLASQNQDQDEGLLKVCRIEEEDFKFAVILGRVEMIGTIISTTGFGFPLQKVFQSSGIKLDEKPKYYQGLNVHGKKREDWAEAGRRGHNYYRQHAESDLGIPLLAAAIEGNLETVEYFLSDAPLRRYLESAETFKEDSRILALGRTKAGLKGTLDSWLSTRNILALHVGVLSPPKPDGSQPIVDFLLEKMPHALEYSSMTGKTPLHLAFEVARYYSAKKLIAAGASQATKDKAGQNILHTILDTVAVDKSSLLRSVFEILDEKLVPGLLLERCSPVDSTGNTPLAVFLNRIKSRTGWEDSLKFLLSVSGGKDLEKMDGAGDYPLHNVVARGHRELTKFIVKYRPGLLYWENATGMTVSQVVTTSYLQYQINHPPHLSTSNSRSIKDQPASDFVKTHASSTDEDESEDKANRSSEWRMYQLITGLEAKYPAKRKLVGLHDANEVAKRLALQQQKKSEESRREAEASALRSGRHFRRFNPRGQADEEKSDEVTEYLPRAREFTKWDEMVWRKTEIGETVDSDGKDIRREYVGSDSESDVSNEGDM